MITGLGLPLLRIEGNGKADLPAESIDYTVSFDGLPDEALRDVIEPNLRVFSLSDRARRDVVPSLSERRQGDSRVDGELW